MPLILKAAGERVFVRDKNGQPRGNMEGIQRWTYIKDRAEVANSFSFEFPEPCFADGSRWIPGQRDEILIYKNETDFTNDTRWFGGILTLDQGNSVLKPGGSYSVRYGLQAQGFDIILDKEIRQPILANMTWENLIKFLVARHFPEQLDQDVTGIVNPVNAPPIKINNGSMRALLRAMRVITGYDFTVDAYKKLRVFQATDNPAPFTLDDSTTGILVFDGQPQIRKDSRQIFNVVRQTFKEKVDLTDWAGETFTAKGDPKGTGGRLPLLRTPTTEEDNIFLEDPFDGETFNDEVWTETDTTTTESPDYPNQGFMFPSLGQLQIVGGTGTLGGVSLASADFYQYRENSYLIQEFQLTSATGEGYFALFTDGAGLATGNMKAGLHVLDGALKTLSGSTLIAALDLTVNYIFWITQTADGWQYDIYGGVYATRQTLHTETGVTHLSDYVLAPIINKSVECSINSFRYQSNELGIILEIDGMQKTLGLERSSTDLPGIDAYLNRDETPAVVKFRAASALAIIADVNSDTEFEVTTGQGEDIQSGHRLLIGTDIVESFNGREAFVQSVAGDVVTLVSPGLSGMTAGQVVLVNTTVPEKDAAIQVKYSYDRDDECTVSDPVSIAVYGKYPLTLPAKDYIRSFSAANLEAKSYLERFSDGILSVNFPSNSALIDEPDTMQALPVNLTRRPDPITRTVTIQRVIVTGAGELMRYEISAESADPVKPFDDLMRGRNLVVGTDGEIILEVNDQDIEVSDFEEITVEEVASFYITLANPDNRRLGEFLLEP